MSDKVKKYETSLKNRIKELAKSFPQKEIIGSCIRVFRQIPYSCVDHIYLGHIEMYHGIQWLANAKEHYYFYDDGKICLRGSTTDNHRILTLDVQLGDCLGEHVLSLKKAGSWEKDLRIEGTSIPVPKIGELLVITYKPGDWEAYLKKASQKDIKGMIKRKEERESIKSLEEAVSSHYFSR